MNFKDFISSKFKSKSKSEDFTIIPNELLENNHNNGKYFISSSEILKFVDDSLYNKNLDVTEYILAKLQVFIDVDVKKMHIEKLKSKLKSQLLIVDEITRDHISGKYSELLTSI